MYETEIKICCKGCKMSDIDKETDTLNHLRYQLSVARNEIKNLRQQVINLKYKHKNDVEEIENVLKELPNVKINEPSNGCICEFPNFYSIGRIESWFKEKRGTLRQGSLCKESQGILVLSSSMINNPSYALNGLEEFSHAWIIYHFHRNNSSSIQTKVTPPRLNGERVGLFSTRSPHRPCPIGLSLVKIDKIVENKIYFSGVDMLDGTPVLDIKPYIPQYDDPNFTYLHKERLVEGGTIEVKCVTPTNSDGATENREAPDGEEACIKVPSWIQSSSSSSSSSGRLAVEIDPKAMSKFNEFLVEDKIRETIIRVLEEDPRSIYLKEKLGSQFYTFSISDLYVTCKFDDANHKVTIHYIKLGHLCECGIPRWQCAVHSN